MDIAKLLEENGTGIKNLSAPDNMRKGLEQAVEKTEVQIKVNNALFYRKLSVVAALIMIISITSYNFNSFAYYGLRLIGYESVMTQTLENLSSLGKGQFIGASKTLKDGSVVTLDQIIIDENTMIAYYKLIDNPEKFYNHNYEVKMYGASREYRMKSSTASLVDENAGEIVFKAEFTPPKWNERYLTFSFGDSGYSEEVVRFKINRFEAMNSNIKAKLNDVWRVDDFSIKLNKLNASPTQTVVNGRVDAWHEFALKYFKGDRTRISNLNFVLIADGKEYEVIGSSLTTGFGGISFKVIFDALPEEAQNIKIVLKSVTIFDRNGFDIDLSEYKEPFTFDAGGTDIIISSIEQKEGKTYFTVKADVNTQLLDVKLISESGEMRFINTLYDEVNEGMRTFIYEGDRRLIKMSIGTLKTDIEIVDK